MLHRPSLDYVTVKAPRHKMRTATFLEQTTFRHDDARLRCHLVVRVLNPTVVGACSQIGILTDGVKLQNPRLETRSKIELANAAAVSPNGDVDAHVQGLIDLGILEVLGTRRHRYRLAQPVPTLAKRLSAGLKALETISDE